MNLDNRILSYPSEESCKNTGVVCLFTVTHTAPRKEILYKNPKSKPYTLNIKENTIMTDILNTKPVVCDITLPVETVEGLPLVLTPKDIAKVLQISRNTAYDVMHRKDFPVLKVGKQYRVSRERFLQWIKQSEKAS